MKLRARRLKHTLETAKPYSPHKPSSKQNVFLGLECLEAFYGGSAGGGKSDALLLAALQYVDVPGYSAGIFRRTLKDLNLPGSIKSRADAWFAGTRAIWDPEIYGYRFKTLPGQPDATIIFGYLGTEQDKYRYQGTEFQFLAIDEVTHFTESSYRYLFSRLRRLKGMPVPIRMRSAGNPGGMGHAWVKKRFFEHAQLPDGMSGRDFIAARRRGEDIPLDCIFTSPPSTEAINMSRVTGVKPEGARYVPAFAEDNPGLDLQEYELSLLQLDETERRYLKDGDWDAVVGGKFFKHKYFKTVPHPPEGMLEVRYWDLAGTKEEKGKDPDWSAGVRLGINRLESGACEVYVIDCTRLRDDPGGVEKHVRDTAKLDGKGLAIWFEEEPGSSGKNNTHNYANRVLFGWNVNGHRKTGPKTEYWKALSSAGRNGALYLCEGPWNREFIEELCALTADDTHAHDDQADAAAGALSVLGEDDGLTWLAMMTSNI